jgi:acetylornithine deacetylase/succinyl-diaminopimelate desuccinylase-like protein
MWSAAWKCRRDESVCKRLPNAIAFGMWFPGKPYPGHDVDEKISIDDLQKGTRVSIYALVDLATGERLDGAFAP